MNSYLLEMYYMDYKRNKYDYQIQRVLLQGTEETIKDIVYDTIEKFNDINKSFDSGKVEQYNLFQHIVGESLKESKESE